jgi:hypothetical protein
MHINTVRPAHNATVLLRERRAPQCVQALALVLTSPLHSGHFFTVIAAPSFRLTPPLAAIVGCGTLSFLARIMQRFDGYGALGAALV